MPTPYPLCSRCQRELELISIAAPRRILTNRLKLLVFPNYCLIPAPVGVPVILWALTISAPSFELCHRVSSGLL